jgi:PAS domain-containing protein
MRDSVGALEFLGSQTRTSNHLSHGILSDSGNGFLFVPGVTLPSAGDNDITAFIQTEKFNPSILEDIQFSQAAASALCGTLTGKYADRDAGAVFTPETQPTEIDGRYRQSYLIFRSGISRLCESSIGSGFKSQRAYYENKFTSNTLLQTRPYFEPTVDNVDFFHSTQPYIDLGGNGVVQTFCHYIPAKRTYPGKGHVYKTDAVVCFDFALKIDIRKAIASQISSFGGAVAEYECANGVCRISNRAEGDAGFDGRFMRVFFPAAEFSSEEEDEISRRYQNSQKHGQESAFFGDITVLNAAAKAGLVEFLLPRGNTQVVAVKFDLNSYEQMRTLWLSLAAACVAITFILAVLILADYGFKFKEQERAFSVVDSVMSDVPAPYARLDEDGKFLKVNDYFAKLMGYASADEGTVQLRDYKYEDFLADDASKEEFKRVKQERREGKPYRSYVIQLWTGRTPGRPPVRWIKVHGGDVPTPHTSRKKPGQSFGILLPTDAPKPIVVMDPRVSGDLPTPIRTDQTKAG